MVRKLNSLMDQQQGLEAVFVYDIEEIRSFANILHIKFLKLQYLNLTDISLESTEQLNRVYCPVLYQLWIDKNKVTNIESFRKTYWLNLGFVIMRCNYVWDNSSFAKTNWEKLTYASLQFGQEEEEQCYDLSWILKQKSNIFSDLRIGSKYRIKRPALITMISKRYKTTNISKFS